MTWRFAQTYVAGNNSIENHITEMRFQFFIYLIGQTQARIVHREQETFDFKRCVQPAFYDTYSIQKLADAFKSKIFCLDGDNH